MLIVSRRPSLSIDGVKPEAQDTLQTNLGTGMRAGYKESTIQGRMVRLNALMKRGAILSDPESVKKTIALRRTWSDGTKANVVDAYDCFLEKRRFDVESTARAA